VALLALSLLFSAAPAHARDDSTIRAKAAFERGRAFYAQGKYEEAVRAFEAGYLASPRPLFLVNLGQAYRQMGELEKAREHYAQFLEQAGADDPQRATVERIIVELDDKIAQQRAIQRASEAKPDPPPAPAPAPVVHAEAPAPKKPFIKRHWWIIPVSAVVVAGVAVGIYFGVTRSGSTIDCSGATLGCLK
jgi:tetratricopeptide (TPR) repeat protein